MSYRSEVLARIAESLADGLTPFQAENEAYSSFQNIDTITSLEPRQELKPGLFIDHQPDSGLIATVGFDEESNGLHVAVADRGTAAWFTMNLRLDLHTMRQGRYLGLIIRQKSEGFVNFRICLRYHTPAGIMDQFFRDVAVTSGGESEQLFFLRLDTDKLPQAVGTEVLFFFDGRSFDTTFQKIESILVK